MNEPRYTLNDLTENEVAMIIRNRETRKDGERHGYYFWGSMLLSFILVLALSRLYRGSYISLIGFIPLVIFFVFNGQRTRRINKIVSESVRQLKEEHEGQS